MMHVFTIMLVIAVVLLTATIFVVGLTVAAELRKLRSAIEGHAAIAVEGLRRSELAAALRRAIVGIPLTNERKIR